MTRLRPTLGALLLLAIPALARAQGDDARVLPRGWLEVRGGGTYTQYDARFTGGGREPLGALYTAQLQPLVERLLTPLEAPAQTALTNFFTQTAAKVEAPVSPPAATVGSLSAQLAADLRRAPVSFSYGLSSRIMVGLSVAVERNAAAVAGIGFSGGVLGLNPNTGSNGAVLAKVDPSYEALGGGALLPIAGSAAGIELQRRVKALSGGDTLQLPTHAVSVPDLLGVPTLKDQLTPNETQALAQVSQSPGYGLGDLELGVRVLLVNGVHGYPVADSAHPQGFRSTLALSGRLPTGLGKDTTFFLELPRERDHAGFSADLLNDWFISRRAWMSASLGITHLFPADVTRRAFSEEQPFPSDSVATRTLRRTPGARIRATLMPRFRLTREMSFALAYRFDHVAADALEASDDRPVVLGPLERLDAWTAHSVGIGGSYSTIEAFMAGRTNMPLELFVLYRTTVGGSGYAPRAGTIEAGGRFLYQLVGRPKRVRPDSVPAAPAAPAPAPPPPPRPLGPPVP